MELARRAWGRGDEDVEAPPLARRRISAQRNTGREENKGEKGEDESVLPGEVGGGGAADRRHPLGGLQLPQTDALSWANRHYYGR